ncbi:hypothetical protein K431DRAFT_39298 [Polychaeton citri CBS 116435]|uniref:Protein kinase domain-containing protein n=1 Tax=Polychaeton citri CBS 116435 TaxID=1314669 RepID=A0A9P4QB97_9PEZI|nr:hypothetical protein K431DRAFT_39298 [Polychaeton citri CBS 116435]
MKAQLQQSTQQVLTQIEQVHLSPPDSTLTVNYTVENIEAIRWEAPDKSVGHFNSSDGGTLECHKIYQGSSNAKNLAVYRGIQYGAFVQQYLGTARIDNQYYAILEHLEKDNSLGRWCADNRLPEYAKRLQLAYNVAKTVAWYHKANLLLKSLNDESVIFKSVGGGENIPYISGVQNIRDVSYPETA